MRYIFRAWLHVMLVSHDYNFKSPRSSTTNIDDQLGGCTIHSFAGVGSGTGSLADLARRVMGNEYTKQRWREVDILIIDEISMSKCPRVCVSCKD